MALPAGMSTVTVTAGPASSADGTDVEMHVRITPSERLVWEATGQPIIESAVTLASKEGIPAQVVLPAVDQAGVLSGRTGAPITGWWYDARIQYRQQGVVGQAHKRFQVLSGSAPVDLDTLPDTGELPEPLTVAPVLLAGPQGDAGDTFASVTTETVAVTADAEAVLGGASPDRTLTFRIPRPNVDPTLARWAAALADRATARADVLCIGDSVTEGQGATTRAGTYLRQFQAALRRAYPVTGVTGGEGYVPAYQLQSSYVHGWDYGGNVTGDGTFGFGHKTLVVKGPDGYGSRSVTGTGFRVWFTRGGSTGSFRVKVDGTTVATVNTVGTATVHDGGTYEHTFTTPGTHTVRLEWAAGGDCYVNGVEVYDGDAASGIHVTDSGSFGSTTAAWVHATNSNAYVLSDDVAVLQPSLVLVYIGLNDWNGDLGSATYGANLRTMMQQVRDACTVAPSFVVVTGYAPSGTKAQPWSAFASAARTAAIAEGAAFIDLGEFMSSINVEPARGLYAGDNYHPSNRGHEVIADALTRRTTSSALTP